MVWTLTTSGACVAKAGYGANWDYLLSGANLATWETEAEGTICTLTRQDWVTNYSTLKTNYKSVLSDVVSDMVAMKIINYDMGGFTSRQEAQTMLDFLRDKINTITEALKQEQIKDKVING